ncbi:MAG: ATP-binding protein [Dehalococcoidia bacterium]
MRSADESIGAVVREMASAREVTGVLRRIPELALAAVEARGATLERVDFDTDEVEVLATAGTLTPAVGARVPYPGSLAADVLEKNAPEVITPAELALRPIAGRFDESCRTCYGLVIPLISEQQALGAILLLRPAEDGSFAPDEAKRMRILGDMAALALRRVLIQEEIQAGVAALQESERRFRLLVESVTDYAIFMLDPDGRVVNWNAGAERLKGYGPGEILGHHLSIFYPEAERERGYPDYELEIAAREGVYVDEGWRVRKDGSRFWAHVTITALRDDEGGLLGFGKVTRNLTERKRAEEERERLLDLERESRIEAERANQAKSDFLANMSHEFRTPLNAIIGYTDLLDSDVAGKLTDVQRGYLDRVRASSQHLVSLVGDVLDMSKVEAGRIELAPRPLRADLEIRAAMELLEPAARAGGVVLTSGCVPENELIVRADPDRLQQVLLNVMGNAVKFTEPDGRVTITCGLVNATSHNAALEGPGPWGVLRIQDTGIGIPQGRIDSIWNPFEQADSGRSRAKEGAGLGLAISRALARLMGGDLVAFSQQGEGSTFLLFLPVAGVEEWRPTRERERRGPERTTAGISVVGYVALAEIQQILLSYVARLRADLDVPKANELSDAVLEDHIATLLADIAETVKAVEDAAGDPSALVRDSQAIQRTLAHNHGKRRADAGWSPAELKREYQILREEVEHAIRRRTDHDGINGAESGVVERGLDLFLRFVDRAEEVSLSSLHGR